MPGKTYYITTPIYYPSDKLHIGNSYTTVAADCLARFKRLQGKKVHFLTGTDEHGQKIQRQAQVAGKSPQEFVDDIVQWIKNLWSVLDISYDDFIRTTEPRHKQAVQKIFQQFYDQGDIYKGKYTGHYCIPCEAFWTERQLKEGNCPDCGRSTELVEEDAYFFRMSRYADRLLAYIEAHPEFIQPPSRKNEMINNFIKPGLEDLCVSRTTFNWGIPVPFDPGHVIYVWLDALSNYITALGYGSDDQALLETFWPADVQLIGKDIVRFHTIYWPIFLMALGLPLPERVFGHGWLLMEAGKMSKSKGNVIDPLVMADRYGSDAIRYFLLREIPFGSDGVFSPQALEQRINSDLANDLGNLLHRTVNMIERFCGGVLPAPGPEQAPDAELIATATSTPEKMAQMIDNLQIGNALGELWQLVRRSNKYIDETAPWTLAKDPGKKARLGTVLYNLAESLRFIGVMVSPFMPRTPGAIWQQLGIAGREGLDTWESLDSWGRLPSGVTVAKGDPLFPRLETEKEHPEANKAAVNINQEKETGEQITIDDFSRIDLRVAQVISAQPVTGADKLLKLQVDLGDETRQVVAGIAKHYRPEDLVGRKVIMVVNLKPVKLRGELSQGMILAASDSQGNLALTTVVSDLPPGSKVK